MIAATPPAWSVFKQIFTEHWDGFKRAHPRYDRRYYDGLVHKMLGCGDPDQMGYIAYRCLQCGEGTHRVAMSCKSSLCLRCAKVYVDNWVSQVSQMLHEGVIYRHIVLTVPEILRKTFYQQAQAVLSPFMRCGVRCLDDVYSRVSGRALKGGYIVVIQTHGRNGQYNPHLHIIATSGGWDRQAKQWVHLEYMPYRLLRQKWQWYLLTMLRQTVKTQEIKRLVDACYTRYREGFVTNIQKGDVPARYQSLARYLAKYVVSPPISLRRIDGYEGHRVTYHYRSHKTERVERETVDVYTFIGRMVPMAKQSLSSFISLTAPACLSQRLSACPVLWRASYEDVCQAPEPDSGGLGQSPGPRQRRDQDSRPNDLPPALSTEHQTRPLALSALSQRDGRMADMAPDLWRDP